MTIPFRDVEEKDAEYVKLDKKKHVPGAIVIFVVAALVILADIGLLIAITINSDIGVALIFFGAVLIIPLVCILGGIKRLKPAKQICVGKILDKFKKVNEVTLDEIEKKSDTTHYYLKVEFDNGDVFDMEVEKKEYKQAKENKKAVVLKNGKKSARVIVAD